MRLPWKTAGAVTECKFGTARAHILACPGTTRTAPYYEAWASIAGVSQGNVQDFDTLPEAKAWCRLRLQEDAGARLENPPPAGQPLTGSERGLLQIELIAAELEALNAVTRCEDLRVRWQRQQLHERYQTALLLKRKA